MFCFDYHYSITLLYPITREKHENKGIKIFIFSSDWGKEGGKYNTDSS